MKIVSIPQGSYPQSAPVTARTQWSRPHNIISYTPNNLFEQKNYKTPNNSYPKTTKTDTHIIATLVSNFMHVQLAILTQGSCSFHTWSHNICLIRVLLYFLAKAVFMSSVLYSRELICVFSWLRCRSQMNSLPMSTIGDHTVRRAVRKTKFSFEKSAKKII